MSGTLASLSDVKKLLNIPQGMGAYDGPLSFAVSSANAKILGMIRRSMEEDTGVQEKHRSIQEGIPFYLQRAPVTAVTSVQVRNIGEAYVDAEYDLLDPDSGEIIILSGSTFPPTRYSGDSIEESSYENAAKDDGRIWSLVKVVYDVGEWEPGEAERAAAAQYAAYIYDQMSQGASSSKKQGSVSTETLSVDMPDYVYVVFIDYLNKAARLV